jgi:hypothetical protein
VGTGTAKGVPLARARKGEEEKLKKRVGMENPNKGPEKRAKEQQR